MKNTIYLLHILLIAVLGISVHSHACGLTAEELFERLQDVPWGDFTHDHDATNMPNHSATTGTHTHEGVQREIYIGVCHASETRTVGIHDIVEPDPPLPAIEGYTEAGVSVCISGSCLEPTPFKVIVPQDLEGNVPPPQVPGEPKVFYPLIKVDGYLYWDRTREPYYVSEEVENLETKPFGYSLEDIDGTLFLVPYEKEHAPVGWLEDVAQQDTLILYRLVEQIGGQNYLEATPFHVHPVDTQDGAGTQGGVDTQDNGVDTQGGADTQGGVDTQGDGVGIQEGETQSYASLDGNFYGVTSNPALPMQVTEYMIRTWGNGNGKLPQWIELYNRNNLAVNIVGYELSYVSEKKTHSIKLQSFLIPPESAIILATHIPQQRHRYGGISESQVYNLEIENALTQGWSLKDSTGAIISETGKAFGEKKPIMPTRLGLSRVSYNVYGSEYPKDPLFFGFRKDVSSPGFHEPQIALSPALLRKKMLSTWASFKKNDRTLP